MREVALWCGAAFRHATMACTSCGRDKNGMLDDLDLSLLLVVGVLASMGALLFLLTVMDPTTRRSGAPKARRDL